MENTLQNAKEYLVKTNFEFFTESEQNVIGKTMVPYADFIYKESIKKLEEKIQKYENALQQISTGEIVGQPKNYKDSLYICRDIAKIAIEKDL